MNQSQSPVRRNPEKAEYVKRLKTLNEMLRNKLKELNNRLERVLD